MNTSPLLFISHSSNDRIYAEGLVNLITTCYGINSNNLICTSVDGYGLPESDNYYKEIYKSIQKSDLVIYICSANYKESQDCLYELAWGFSKDIKKQFFFAVDNSDLKDKLKLCALTTFHKFVITDLWDLKERLDEVFRKSSDAKIWSKHTQTFTKNIEGAKAAQEKSEAAPTTKVVVQKKRTAGPTLSSVMQHKPKAVPPPSIANITSCSATKAHDSIDTSSTVNTQSSRDLYNQIINEARSAIYSIKKATKWMILATVYQGRDSLTIGEHDCYQGDFQAAMNATELDSNAELNKDERHVKKALAALENLCDFLNNEKHLDFLNELEEELDINISMDNSDYWNAIF